MLEVKKIICFFKASEHPRVLSKTYELQIRWTSKESIVSISERIFEHSNQPLKIWYPYHLYSILNISRLVISISETITQQTIKNAVSKLFIFKSRSSPYISIRKKSYEYVRASA